MHSGTVISPQELKSVNGSSVSQIMRNRLVCLGVEVGMGAVGGVGD